MWWPVLLLSVFVRLTLTERYDCNEDVLKVLTQVAERVQREETGVHDVLCIDCHATWSEELFVAFHKLHPLFPIKILNSSHLESHQVDQMSSLYRASLILVSCVYNGQCLLRQMLASPGINKYSIYFQLYINATNDILDQAIVSAKRFGISRLVQLLYDPEAARIWARCAGALVPRAFELPLTDVPVVLFNGSLTRLDQFNYFVSIIPLAYNVYVVNRTLSGFEADIFAIIVKHQRAEFKVRILKSHELSKALTALHGGRLDVILNNILTSGRTQFERAIWQEHSAYCITLPKRLHRAHLQLLVHPFEWPIWLILIAMLSFMQLLNLIFPAKFASNFIMMCFFGSGPPEHSLATAERLLLCSVCVIIFLLSETYQAILLSLIAADPYLKNPETVDEFLARNISLYALKGLVHLLPPALLPVVKIVPSTSLFDAYSHSTIQQCTNVLFWNANPLNLWKPAEDELITVKPPLFYIPNFVTFSQLSPATRAYQMYMDRLFETGIYQVIHQKWYPRNMYQEKEVEFNDSIVLPEDLVPVWELFAIGLAVSTIVFFGEWVYYYWKQR